MRRGMLMHAIMKFRMRRRDRYKCDVPHPLPLDGKYHVFCFLENKQKGTSRQRSGKGAIRKRFPLQKTEMGKKQTNNQVLIQ